MLTRNATATHVRSVLREPSQAHGTLDARRKQSICQVLPQNMEEQALPWRCQDAATLRAAGNVLLATGSGGSSGAGAKLTRLLVGTDAFGLADAPCAEALHAVRASHP